MIPRGGIRSLFTSAAELNIGLREDRGLYSMKISPSLILSAAALSVFVFGGCRKPKDAGNAGAAVAPQETGSAQGAAPGKEAPHSRAVGLRELAPEPAAGAAAASALPGSSDAPSDAPSDAGRDPAVAGVPAELLASDRAYEAWFKKHGLDLNDPKMLDADPDSDGFTNREEFLADTDPKDANARPGVHKVMRLKAYHEVRVPLLLEAVEGQMARIRQEAGGETKLETVTVGQMVGGLKVSKVAARRVTDKGGHPADLSRVELEDLATREKVVLVKDLPAKSSASYAVLTSEKGGALKVHQCEQFSWPEDPTRAYVVIDLRADQVIVQEIGSKQVWTISKTH